MFVPAYAVAGGGVPLANTANSSTSVSSGNRNDDTHNQQNQTVVERIPTVACPGACMKCSYGVMPHSTSAVRAVGLPMSLLVRPLAVNMSKNGVVPSVQMYEPLVRCDECSAFINPYVTFSPDGSFWTCSICGFKQPVPREKFSPINGVGQREDTAAHPEFTHGCVDFAAPDGFFSRTPMAPTFVFLLDISRQSVVRGLLDVSLKAIRRWISRYDDNSSARVSFVLYSRSVTYVQFIEKTDKYSLFTYVDLDELNGSYVKERLFVRPETIMVSLKYYRELILKFLDDLPAIVGKDGCNTETGNALPSALYACIKFSRFWGGRIIAFQGSSGACCDSGPFAVPSDVSEAYAKRNIEAKADDDGSLAGAFAFGTIGDVYREIAVECCQRQSSVSLVVAEPVKGLAVLEQVVHFTGGSLVTLNLPQRKVDGEEEEDPIAKTMWATSMRTVLSLLCRQTGWESVMRFYCSDGISIANAKGNFFMRGTDLIATLCSDAGNTLSADVRINSTLKPGQNAVIQCVYMYTTVSSRRRIRVMTICLPITSSIHDIFNSLDVNTLAVSYAKTVCEDLQRCTFQEAREKVIGLMIRAMKCYRASFDKGMAPRNRAGLMLPTTLDLLPLFLLALLKSPVLTKDRVNGETRAKYACIYRSLPGEYLLRMLHPRLYDLNIFMTKEDINPGSSNGSPEKLQQLSLTESSLQDGHLYLLDMGNVLLLYEHGSSNPEVISALFGVESLSEVPLYNIITNSSDGTACLGCRVLRSFIETAETNSLTTPRILVVKDIRELLVGDHTHSYYSYHEFVTMLGQ